MVGVNQPEALESANFVLTQLLQYLTDQKIPEVERINDFIPTIEKRAKISMNDYLGKGELTSPQTKTDLYKKYYREFNKDGEEHDRGIRIWNDGSIEIGNFEDDFLGTGNYIHIYSGGWFQVGEIYK